MVGAPKLIKKLLNLSDKKDGAGPSASATTSLAPRLLPVTATILHTPLLHTPSRLLSLPGEVRNKVYAYAIYSSLSTITLYRSPETVLSLPIFAICRQMRSEAISRLCASKTFFLSGIRTANAFLEMIGSGVSDLRFVTIRCETDWRSKAAEMAVEREVLLQYLQLATSLRSLRFVIGGYPLNYEDTSHLANAASLGARFLFAVRSVVDHEKSWAEEETALSERFLALCDQSDAVRAVCSLKEELKEEHEERLEKVFQLEKVISLEGRVGGVMLPLRMPEYLTKTDADP